ncbi:hypothetical protein [Amycolatopsis pretoriensis]|uniref:hypothetical protein n=1 Tax=Amycolatopsis pretoriensis TaxID=218821 RepID=UPI001302A648|nr:hypothetical protein [Amycolatopsis pretoriensis]
MWVVVVAVAGSAEHAAHRDDEVDRGGDQPGPVPGSQGRQSGTKFPCDRVNAGAARGP